MSDPLLQRLSGHVQVRPDAEALRQKVHGLWHSWRWRDVAGDVEQLAQGLQERGVTQGDRLVFSGAFAASLLLLALASRRLQATTVLLAEAATQAEIEATLAEGPVRFVFLGERGSLKTWQTALGASSARPTLVALYALPPGHHADTAVLDLLQLVPTRLTPAGVALSRDRAPRLWIEAGTDWPEGLSLALQHWLETGEAAVLPESQRSATRDRQEVAPETLLIAPHALQGWQREVRDRLAAPETWTGRRLTRAFAATRAGRAGLIDRWLIGRIRNRVGLARLSRVITGLSLLPAESASLLADLGVPSGLSAESGAAEARPKRTEALAA